MFGDGYADGLEAFLTAYHGIQKPGMSNKRLCGLYAGLAQSRLDLRKIFLPFG